MKVQALFAAMIVTGLASPAAARNLYVVKNLITDKCYVLPKKPKTKTVVLVNGSIAYKSRAEARSAVKNFVPCKT